MKHIFRLFSATGYKGTRNYINSQKRYEIVRTLIYFAIPISLFIAGYIATKTRLNWLTMVAVLGCLPASKSLVNCIMFLRYNSCPDSVCKQLEEKNDSLTELFDMVFTSYSKNFVIYHMVIKGNTICGYTEMKDFPEKEFQSHIMNVLKLDGHKNITVKIFTDIDKYIDRIVQLNESEAEDTNDMAIAETLKSVVL